MKSKKKSNYVMNKFGVITKVVKNQFQINHKNSQEEYELLKIVQKKKTNYIKENIIKHLSKIQSKILKINLKNIDNIIDYYFNNETYRINSYQDRIFIQSSMQIYEMLRNIRNLTEETIKIKKIMDFLNIIKVLILEQRKYIKEIQEKANELKENSNKYSLKFSKTIPF